jgi:hypothetical protein
MNAFAPIIHACSITRRKAEEVIEGNNPVTTVS